MSTLRLLVMEGNTARTRAEYIAFSGKAPSDGYAAVLRDLAPGAHVDVCYPADAGAALPRGADLAGYDGVVITGSSLHLWQAEDAALRQVDMARSVYRSQVPFFGSCWGLQVAAAAAGGTVTPNPNGRELGISRKVVLTDEGRSHPLHLGRASAFDAPAVHLDAVTGLPADITVTARNSMTHVQAAEIRHDGGTFWGVQYHPEYSLRDIAHTIERYGHQLIDDGFFGTLPELHVYAADLHALHSEPANTGLAWRLGIDRDIIEPALRLTEINNWLEAFVRPVKSRRSRA